MRSLSSRLVLTILGFALPALLAVALWLGATYRAAAERDFRAVLLAHLFNVVGAMEDGSDGSVSIAEDLGDPRFGLPDSGWYWAIVSVDDGSPLALSPSLVGRPPTLAGEAVVPFDDRFRRSYRSVRPDGGASQHLEARLFLGEGDRLVQVIVAADRTELRAVIAGFIGRLTLSFLAIAIGLVVVTILGVRVGLEPLRAVREQLAAVRRGESEALDESVPREVVPLVREVNELIGANRSIVERARRQAGDLAHALKTPLAVIRNDAAEGRTDRLEGHIDRMEQQVRSHLDRAMRSARRSNAPERTVLADAIDPLVRTMTRLHPDIRVEARLSEEAGLFRGTAEDLQEMLGNLIENAVRFARANVTISAEPAGEGRLRIHVDDDGPGLSPADREAAIRRGERLDARDAGSGLGLSIASQMAADHGGSLLLDDSPAGGLRATLVLPRSSRKQAP